MFFTIIVHDHYVLKKKIVLVGDWAVGKTSLIDRFVLNSFSDKYVATIGSKVCKKELCVNGQFISLMIWDLLGQKGYSTVQSSALRAASGAVLVADMTRKETLENLTWYWVPQVMEHAGNIPMVFLGNKADLSKEWQFGDIDLHREASQFSAPHILTSAKAGTGVEQAFAFLGASIIVAGDNALRAHNDPPAARPITSLVEATDAIMMDFCRKWGSEENGMAILRHKFNAVGMNINDPDRGGLNRVIGLLQELEDEFQGHDAAVENARFRLSIVKNAT
jgi:small GTP-binding protein